MFGTIFSFIFLLYLLYSWHTIARSFLVRSCLCYIKVKVLNRLFIEALKRSQLQRRSNITETDSEEIVPVKETVAESVPHGAKEEDEEEDDEEFETDEEEQLEKPKFTKKLVDIEVIEGSAARMEVVVDGEKIYH